MHTKPRQKQTALENLERQRYSCYLPASKLEKPRGKTLVDSNKPMFPRYLFVDINRNFKGKIGASILSTHGVHELVRIGSESAEINFDLFNAIFKR